MAPTNGARPAGGRNAGGRNFSCAVASLLLLALTAACNDARPGPAPSPVQPAPPPAEPTPPPPTTNAITSVRVVSGWDDTPVVRARVHIDGTAFETDGDGRVTVGSDIRDRAIDIEARGFLLRQTRVTTGQITLWPVAGQADADAIRAMVFLDLGLGAQLVNLGVVATLVLTPDMAPYVDSFRAASDRINELMRESRYIVRPDYGGIDHAVWTIEQGWLYGCDPASEILVGFCLPAYYSRGEPEQWMLYVTAEALGRPHTPLQMLAYAHIVGPNPRPGLLNPATPGVTDLSLLEQQTLRMLSQRRSCTRWPDNDRDTPC